MDELGLRKHLKDDIERHQKFQALLGAEVKKVQLQDVDLKNYAKHMLKVGETAEKRQILSHLKDRLVLKDRRITID